MPEKIIEYFDKRGIGLEVLERNQIQWNGKEIIFPYIQGKRIVNAKYRDLDKKFRQEKDKKKIFYGLDDLVDQDTAIIVEGEIDKLSLEAVGYKNCVSVPDGAPAATAKTFNGKFDYIDNCIHCFDEIKKIIIAVDNDAPGYRLAQELIKRFGPDRCYVVDWQTYKDANHALKINEFDLIKCIDSAKPVPVEGVFTIDDISKDIDNLYNNDFESFSTGWPELDPYYNIAKRQFTVLTGIPMHGKSTWLDALTVNLAQNNDWKFAVFSPENQPIAQHAAQIAKCYMGKQFFKGFNNRMTPEELEKAKHWMKSRYYFILPPDDTLTIDHILSKAEVLVSRYGINGIVIDPYNELDHSRSKQYTETEYISCLLTKIRRFARKHNVHIWLVAHPTKMPKQINGNYGVPTPYDIAGSANFRNKPDNCICVWRDLTDESSAVDVYVQKVRFRHLGKVGSVKLGFDIATGRYI